MKSLVKVIAAVIAMTNISACGWLFGDDGTFRDRSDDYRQATVETPLRLPEGIDSESIDDNYAIPIISDRTSLSEVFVIPKPEPLSDDINRDSVRINTLDKQQWILVDNTPGQVWPRLRGFLNLNQLSVQRADAVNGLIETAWLQPTGDNALRERYRLRIEQGVQRGSSEVYVLQADLRAGLDTWPQQSNNTEREKIMTQELAQYLADSASAAAVSMLAQQAIDSSGKVTLEETDTQQSFIKLQLPFTRAWASVGRALEKAGYQVDDLNRSENLYYIHYIEREEKEDEGFFDFLSNWGSSNKDNDEGVAYYIRVRQLNEQAVTISIERQSGDAMEKEETDQLLKLIKRHLS